jgi:hypothetical protein
MSESRVTVDIKVVITTSFRQALGIATALSQYDLDDEDVGGADDLREMYVELADALNIPEPAMEEEEASGTNDQP